MKRLTSIVTAGLCALTIGTAVAAPMPFAQEPFTDVRTTHPNYDAIEYLRQQNVLRGYLDGNFKPDASITRAEFVSILMSPLFVSGTRENDCLATHFSGTGTIFFPDVDRKSEAAQNICAATLHEVIRGYADGTFKPNNRINFAEAAKIAGTVFSLQVRRDTDSDPRWYAAYVMSLSDKNAIPKSIRSVTQSVSRGEMAEILYRLKQNITTKTFTPAASMLK